ncbi:hypothetical protein FJT64_003650 [Amphibalanus amphitrite]|uniref:Uncharacterized protein n=1 Tax=Amphibalanus amphitrite TaxID=1232801 RepID=A0A6A4WAE9_AMPAM|nr:hypothetical protein FJT64_003650 [Amphibalanus amphitrite]
MYFRADELLSPKTTARSSDSDNGASTNAQAPTRGKRQNVSKKRRRCNKTTSDGKSDASYAVPVGTAFFLTAITAAQYGFLPVRNRHIADGVEAINRHLRALSWPSKRYRQPRAALASPLPAALQELATAFRHLEEGQLRHDRPRAALGVRRRL